MIFLKIWWIVPIAISIATIVFAVKTKKRVPEDQVNQEPLTRKEKLIVWLYSILNPLIAGAILYYWWRKKLPVKAKQANKISWFVGLILIILYWGMIYFFAWLLPA